MSTIITVEKLGKKYTLHHQQRESYTALRDVITNGVTSLGKKLLHPIRRPLHSVPCTLDPAVEDFWALEDVSFEVQQGDRIGIIGRNGAGKSTLLKILSRITEPSTGSVRIKGRVASLLEVGTGFHPELTGRENIFLNGAILGMGRAEIRKKFDEIVAFAEIEKFLDTPVKRYSSGMYVRLAFAVAAHLEPEILVVDEVLAVGDAQFQKKCLGKMEEVSAKEGRTVLFVSHNMSAINRLCRSVLLLSSGRVVCQGETTEVISSYMNTVMTLRKAIVDIPDDPAKVHQIVAVRVYDSNNDLIDRTLNIDESFAVTFSCKMDVPLLGAYATLEIKNQNGEYVLFSDNRDHSSSSNFGDVGVISVVITVPAPLLVAGKYFITVSIARPIQGTVDECVDAAVIEIEDIHGVRPNRPGYIYLPLQWRKVDSLRMSGMSD